MGKFMQWMQGELEEVREADIVPPKHTVQKGEEVLGTLEDVDLQKLFALLGQLAVEASGLAKKHAHKLVDLAGTEGAPDHDPATCELCAMVKQLNVLTDKLQTIDVLFMTCVRHELSEAALAKLYKAGGTIDIRKDWKIVVVRQASSPLETLLSAAGLRF